MENSDSRTRFIETMEVRPSTRPPLFEEGIREDVLNAWRGQGLSRGVALDSIFSYDPRFEVYLELGPLPEPAHWPTHSADLEDFISRFNLDDPARFPTGSSFRTQIGEEAGLTRILQVHRGFFLTAGVDDWKSFKDTMLLAMDDPGLVREILKIQAAFGAELVNKFLAAHQVEAALFSEPIGGNHGPLISPKMYAQLILPTYRPLFETLQANGVTTIIWRTYADTRALLPLAVEAGINCLWACECGTEAMDYRAIRAEFGSALRLIGGIDLDVLYGDVDGIRNELETKVPPLLEQGGFLPLLDGRVRKIVPFEKYRFYRNALQRIVRQ